MENPFDIFDERLARIEDMLQKLTEAGKVTEQAPQEDELLTTAQLMKLAKVSRMTILRWRKKGAIQAVRLGKTIRFRKSDLLKMKRGA